MTVGRIAIVFRGDRRAAMPPMSSTRLGPVVEALTEVGLVAEPAVYGDEATEAIRSQLRGVDGVLVWVDPVTEAGDRTNLDAILREAAAEGVWVSAHPDAILKMGTKEVLYQTRELGWGSETHLYRSIEEFSERFPAVLSVAGARVLKQYRGNGGIGVHKVELVAQSPTGESPVVRVQSARMRDEATEELLLTDFMQRCARYFAYADGSGRLIDQPFQPRITEGIVRCYLVKGEVVGFARQYPTAPAGEPSANRRVFGLPSAKTMFDREEKTLRTLRTKVESEWLPAMQTLVDLDSALLPALWDADFLLGPKDESGEDTYVLCEINVSAVTPFPAEAPAKLAQAALAAVREAKLRKPA
jgi:glutathione synthase/RimK-type ligase-like ATP-grasp enzyme